MKREHEILCLPAEYTLKYSNGSPTSYLGTPKIGSKEGMQGLFMSNSHHCLVTSKPSEAPLPEDELSASRISVFPSLKEQHTSSELLSYSLKSDFLFREEANEA